jgi:hypothetical protein
MKKYIVKYTIKDGEFEYSDTCLYNTSTEPTTDEFDLEFFKCVLWEDEKSAMEGKWYISEDYRIAKIDSYQEVSQEDYNVLKKYI